MLGGAGGCERRASDVSSAAAPSAFAASSSRVRRRPARVRGIVVIAHARASHLELGHWLGGLGCAQGWGELLYMCFYLRVRHAACGTGKSRWNVVVCVESGVRLWGAAFRFWNAAFMRGIQRKRYIYVRFFYLGVRHAACGKGNARWNAVVCVESGVRLWGAALRFGMRRSCLEFSEKAWNLAQKVEFSENAWNSAQTVEFGRSTLEFEFHIGIPGFTVEFSQKAWNSRNSVESAGVVLVMWAVIKMRRCSYSPLTRNNRLPLESTATPACFAAERTGTKNKFHQKGKLG